MASQVQINIRRDAALARVEDASGTIARYIGQDPPVLRGLHKVPDIAQAMRLENLAESLECAAAYLEGSAEIAGLDPAESAQDVLDPLASDLAPAVLAGTVDQAVRVIEQIQEPANLSILADLETAGRGRKGILDAIAVRLSAIMPAEPATDPADPGPFTDPAADPAETPESDGSNHTGQDPNGPSMDAMVQGDQDGAADPAAGGEGE